MTKHAPGLSCPRCDELLATAHIELARWYRIRVKPLHLDVHVCWAWRDQKDQEQAFATGHSKDHWPKSPHNHMEGGLPCSLALDLFEQINGIGYWRYKTCAVINSENEVSKQPISWGAVFKSLGDFGHFQLIIPDDIT